jgi:predicted metal-dependent hydrolase
MAFKQFVLDEHTTITIYKRKSSRSLRLSVTAAGQVRVTIPTWAPYSAGVAFARSRQHWINDQKQPATLLREGQPIGKAHHLHFVASSLKATPASRLQGSLAVITYPAQYDLGDPAVQKAARAVSIRALRSQAEALLPQRLEQLAKQHGFHYRSVSIKRLKSRWGSCDSHNNIVLNLFLMQLSWDSIDYVLLHELTHTRILQHGPRFWSAMERLMPNVQQMRKTMRSYQPVL